VCTRVCACALCACVCERERDGEREGVRVKGRARARERERESTCVRAYRSTYEVATISRLPKIVGLFCRVWSLL